MKHVDKSKTYDPPAKGPEFLTVGDWASRLQVSKRTIFRMIDEGSIPPYDVAIGKVRRWHEATYQRWVDEQTGGN